MNSYGINEPVFGVWYIDREIGSGAFGTVYRLKRESFGTTYYSALKVIRVPQNKTEIKQLRQELGDDGSVSQYYTNFVQDFAKEIELMARLKGNSYLVSYEDHDFIQNEDGFGWTILIRMELLTTFTDYQAEHPLDNEDIVRLGTDLCSALDICEQRQIIHRDIKPDNIFVSDNGDFKLGDFGIARELEKTTGGLSKKGTYSYMAPEVYLGKPYNHTVDIYSLGIVMYRLLNRNRQPFLPAYPAPITFSDRENALRRRMSGEEIPDIPDIPASLNAIVKKACAFDPKDRYASAAALNADAPTVNADEATAPIVTQPTPTPQAPLHREPSVATMADEDEKTASPFDELISAAAASQKESPASPQDDLIPASVLKEIGKTPQQPFNTVKADEDEKTASPFDGVIPKAAQTPAVGKMPDHPYIMSVKPQVTTPAAGQFRQPDYPAYPATGKKKAPIWLLEKFELPKKQRITAIGISALGIAMLVPGFVFWLLRLFGIYINIWFDLIPCAISAAITAAGLVLLLIRRPRGYLLTYTGLLFLVATAGGDFLWWFLGQDIFYDELIFYVISLISSIPIIFISILLLIIGRVVIKAVRPSVPCGLVSAAFVLLTTALCLYYFGIARYVLPFVLLLTVCSEKRPLQIVSTVLLNVIPIICIVSFMLNSFPPLSVDLIAFGVLALAGLVCGIIALVKIIKKPKNSFSASQTQQR